MALYLSMEDSSHFRFKASHELVENPFFASVFLFCEGKKEPKTLMTVEVSCLSLMGEAMNQRKPKQTEEEAYANALLQLIKETQKSLTINFIDTEYERSKQGISKNCIN
jgi:hypothetical protein